MTRGLSVRTVALVVLMLGAAGCTKAYGPDVAVDWPSRPTPVADIQRPAGHGVLQVITGYTPPLYSHAAMRLETADGHVVFWDPGGDYAKTRSTGRDADRIPRPPDIAEYIRWRLDVVGDRGGEVFEWDIPADKAAHLADVLENGRSGEGPDHAFDPDVPPTQCSMTISKYLRWFAPEYANVRRNWFFPYELAQALYKHNADRIIVYRLDAPVRVYYRPAPALDAAASR